jgi:hypothetical protein
VGFKQQPKRVPVAALAGLDHFPVVRVQHHAETTTTLDERAPRFLPTF